MSRVLLLIAVLLAVAFSGADAKKKDSKKMQKAINKLQDKISDLEKDFDKLKDDVEDEVDDLDDDVDDNKDDYKKADASVTSNFQAGDTALQNAYTAADAAVTTAFGAADTVVTTAYTAADTGITTAYTAADAGITAAYTAADTGITAAYTAADTVVTTAFGTADAAIIARVAALEAMLSVVSGTFGTTSYTDGSSTPLVAGPTVIGTFPSFTPAANNLYRVCWSYRTSATFTAAGAADTAQFDMTFSAGAGAHCQSGDIIRGPTAGQTGVTDGGAADTCTLTTNGVTMGASLELFQCFHVVFEAAQPTVINLRNTVTDTAAGGFDTVQGSASIYVTDLGTTGVTVNN